MDRASWLREQRHRSESDYDQLWSATYDATAEPMTETHRRFVEAVVAATPAGGSILDVPCGTGKYFAVILDAGRKVVGADQSAGMLAQARSKFPDVELIRSGLQELDLGRRFDGATCIDAMENIPPEDWPGVVARLTAAVTPGGPLYVTVERHEDAFIEAGLADGLARGLPMVRGEHTFGERHYHYFPSDGQVRTWLAEARLALLDEAVSPGEGYEYWHLLLRTPAAA